MEALCFRTFPVWQGASAFFFPFSVRLKGICILLTPGRPENVCSLHLWLRCFFFPLFNLWSGLCKCSSKVPILLSSTPVLLSACPHSRQDVRYMIGLFWHLLQCRTSSEEHVNGPAGHSIMGLFGVEMRVVCVMACCRLSVWPGLV